ncbi:MAG: S46 family peptidase [Bacteroidetes bacterium]|nr:MAG: S46 family peptidase [Bacteroidota bacterium]
MKRIFTTLVATLTLLGSRANSFDEGMWLPILLKDYNYAEMQRLGLKLTPEQIYSVNNSSLKDAVIWFNGGCTGEIISDKGLVLTNHHCGYGAIAKLSTKQDNILDNGFFAKSMAEERPASGMWVATLNRMEDVSDQILPNLEGLSEKERSAKISELSQAIEAKASEEGKYMCMVRGLFNDNQFILYVMKRYTDIRLVGTPPQNIGKYGGDTDNWMWPRHTGDFSMFRIYAGKDNEPAAYSEENVAFKPAHSLPVSLKGIQEGDFAMVMGFPGRTNRYATSFELEVQVEDINPVFIRLRDARLKIMLEEMKKDDSVRLLLTSNYAQVANYWKNYIGMTEQVKRLKVIDFKKANEEKFSAWAAGKPEFENVLNNLRQAHNTYKGVASQPYYLREGILSSVVARNANFFKQLRDSLAKKDISDENLQKTIDNFKKNIGRFYTSYNTVVDQRIMAATLNLYYEGVPAEQRAELVNQILKKYKKLSPKQAFEKYAEEVFKKSMFTSLDKVNEFLAKPSLKKLEKDPAYQYARSFVEHYEAKFETQIKAYHDSKAIYMRSFVKGMQEMDAKLVQYPDANSTMRLTYGSVQSYDPKDAVHFNYYTTIEGVMEKYVPGDYEFDLPQGLIDLYKKKDYGQYANTKGELPVAFITNNDITGGNSGSPVINGSGQLIGLAFDGNWEAMSGDLVFDPKYKRCINVDIRYVLFIIDKFHGAGNIINELNLVK